MSRRLILEQIIKQPHLSRSDLVDLTGLSKGAVSSIVSELIQLRLVRETGQESSPISRPRILLSLESEAGFVLGAEITLHEYHLVLTNLYGDPIKKITEPIHSGDLSAETLSKNLLACVQEITQDMPSSRILALGVCVPGVVDPTSGRVSLSVMLPWKDVPLAKLLGRELPYPVVVFSRGSAATWGECWYGAGKGVDNLLYVRVGTGIVGGLVIRGQPYVGSHFGAGELGHMTVDPQGVICQCGNQGCLATVATVNALLNQIRYYLREDMQNPLWTKLDYNPEQLTLDDVLAAARQENPIVIQALGDIARWLGIALAGAINLLNLNTIIIGGPLAAAGEALTQPLRRELAQRTLPTHLAPLTISLSALKEYAPAVGAASLVLHELISPRPAQMTTLSQVDLLETFHPL